MSGGPTKLDLGGVLRRRGVWTLLAPARDVNFRGETGETA